MKNAKTFSRILTDHQIEVIEKVFDEGYTDDHDEEIVRPDKVGIWLRNFGQQIKIIAIFDDTFCCNPLFHNKEDDKIHLAVASCGGTCIGGNIDRFNREMSPNNTDGLHTIEMIIPIEKEGWKKLKKHVRNSF